MKDLFRSKRAWVVLTLVVLMALMVPVTVFATRSTPARATGQKAQYSATTAASKNSKFCSRVDKSLGVSQGARMMCKGPQANGTQAAHPNNPSFGTNVDAANPKEDRSPSGTQAYGQSETSVAAAGQYVVEAWNDATGFFAPCPSPMDKESLTGYGFSNDGGKTFKDLGGLPNANCATSVIIGDPGVEAYTVNGQTYFYISSIFIPFNVPQNDLSITACKVNGSGSSATLSCGQPIVAAASGQCVDFGGGFIACSFLDKEYITLDAARARLYMSYTDFGVNFFPPDRFTNGQIELAVCDLSNPASPTCYNGSQSTGTGAAPYFVVSPGDLSCEKEGAYPAVDPATGAVYVAFEFNWATNIFGSFGGTKNCLREPLRNQVNYIPAACLTIPVASCKQPAAGNSVNVFSESAAFIPGYNRFPMNDFPRIAVSDQYGTVSIVWNDTRRHPLGDILLQSFDLVSLAQVQRAPLVVNSTAGGTNILPGLRYPEASGLLDISWYSRASGNTAITDVSAAFGVNPRATGVVASNTMITTGPSDWNAVSSDIVPNFGDYTDNYNTGTVDYIAWADGRLGDPQPFQDHR